MTLSVLVVDDEPDVAELFRQRFRRERRRGTIDLHFALSGDDALEILRHEFPEPPEFLLSDVNMPGMTGIELVEAAKSKWPGIRAIVITAYGDNDTRARALAAGADAFITKPVDFAGLKSTLSLET